MNPLTASFEQTLQGELDLEDLSVRVKKYVQASPEDTETLLDQVTALYQTEGMSEADATKLEYMRQLIKVAKAESSQPEDATALASRSQTIQPKPSDIPEITDTSLGIGSVIKDRFELVEVLGQGGMGIVYKAKDKRKVEAMDRQPFVALKVLNDEFRKNPESFIALQRETRKSQALAHPNIVTVYDFDTDGPHVYMTMECLKGKPLSAIMNQQESNAEPIKNRWSLINQLGNALRYAHEKKIIHSDLKPGNIFVSDDGILKVLDFGIARAVKDSDQKRGETTYFDAGSLNCLTPAYASCEMFEGQAPDIRDDIYAFGCVVYGILAGHHPFNKIPAIQARNNQLKPEPIKGLKRKLWNAIKLTLEFKREKRTPTIKDFLLISQPRKESGTGTSISRWMGSIVLVAIILGGISIYRMKDPSPEPVLEPIEPPQPAQVLTPKEIEKIDRLLEIAEIHLAVGRITYPPGSNALFAYQQVLALNPANRSAKQGLGKIADDYLKQAQDLLAQGDGEKAFELVETGLRVVPKHRPLLTLYQKVKPEKE